MPTIQLPQADDAAVDDAAVEAAAAVAAADSVVADSLATLARRYPRAFASNGKPLWRQGGIVSSAPEAHLARSVASALPVLLVFWWGALSLRAYAVDQRRRGTVIVLAGLLGAAAWATLGPLMVAIGMAALDDRYGTGPALLCALVVACLGAMVMTWSIADPRDQAHSARRAPVLVGTDYPTTATVAEPLRTRLLVLYRWTLAGTALGLLVVGVAYGYNADIVRAGGPERLAIGLAGVGLAAGVVAARGAGRR